MKTTGYVSAIVIDRQFVGDEHDTIKFEIEKFVDYVKREVLKSGGVNAFYFSWAAINVKRDFSAILSITSCEDTWRLFRAADPENILHMAVTESECPRLPTDRAITVPLITKGKELAQLMLDFKTEDIYDWKSAVVIYDEMLDRDMAGGLVKAISQRSNNEAKATGVSLIKLKRHLSKEDLRAVLSTIHTDTVGTNFLAVVGYNLVHGMMEIAKTLNLVNTETQWLYVISDTDAKFHDIGTFRKILREGDNTAFVYNISHAGDECVGGRKCHVEELILSFSEALSEAIKDEYEIASQVSEEEWEAIRPTKDERRNFLHANIKKDLTKNGVCGNCTFWKVSTGDTWGGEFQGKTNTINLHDVGTWRPNDGTSFTDVLFLHVAHGFRSKLLPLVSYHNPPWQILKLNTSGEIIEYSGLVFDIIRELARNLNFTFTVELINKTTIKSFNDSNLGAQDYALTNDIPRDLLTLVQNKSVAMGACALTVLEAVKNSVNYTIPISTQTYSFLAARPRELSRALLFISPFTGDTWLCLFAAIISMGPFLYFINRFSPVCDYKGIPRKGGLSSIQNCIWYMYGALLQQGGMHLPYPDSARIVVGAWWLVVLVISTTYCGNLVAFLTFPKIDIPITTVNDLINHQDVVSWSFREGNYLESQLKDAREARYRTIYNLRVKKSTNYTKFIKEIEEGKHVYLDWKMRLQYIMKEQFLEKGRCDFALGIDEFVDENLAFIVSPNLPYLTKINREIKKLHQVGLIQKWLKDYLPKKDRCWKNRHLVEVNNHTVNMDDMQGSFFILFLGFTLAVIWLTGEKLWFRHKSKNQRKVIQPFAS
ncbi:unnamed protein product [Acanthoscelides obtectus]|uniref:Ionotropic glutamate receptor C-terminal domain-containing protein n=1 Tax=Acanthoscelides obtectus TaxID=200917 RepID=A0A9P0LAD8_ACAOB|nr:unnamed protein product [Acanthoscelides obtectus]CAK1652873.1 Ionotropic receptor 93a [Acanthoscelides obtectus]